ncbi:MAG TPA: PfkB family carbohydrate kinase [Polyangiaceae bacterium]|jgi:fructokinase|nr:PfkB family carbohydrate kinase [Polyangiaceae bacterium]
MTTEPHAPRFIAWGELLWDLFPDRPRLGGAAANAAYHAHCLGAEALLVSRVGKDELGLRARSELSARGVDVRAIQIDDAAPTGTVNVELVDGEPRYRIATSVAWDRIAWQPELDEIFDQANVICFGTLAQRSPLGFDAIEHALSRAPKTALRLCDLNVREPFATPKIVERALSLASAVKLNENEVATLSRSFGQKDVTRWLLEERGIELVAVTRGARGAALSTKREQLEHPGFPLSSTNGDPVGAGDAFSAALSLELCRKSPLDVCLERANRYAAHVASRAGGMPSATDYKY